MNSHRRVSTSVAAITLLAFSSTASLAATEQEVTDALKALLQSGEAGATVDLGTPAVNGDAIVYSNVKLTAEGTTTTVGTLTVTGAEVENGLLDAASIRAEAITIAEPGSDTGTIGDAEIVNLAMEPGENGGEPEVQADSLAVNEISITSADGPPVTIDSVRIQTTDYVDGYPAAGTFEVAGMEIDVAAAGADDPTAQQMIALGYEKLVLGLSGASSWDEAAGVATLEELTIEAENVGELTLTAVIGGLSGDVLAELQKPEPNMEVMQQVTLNEASLSFSDASITNKLLDVQAQQMGVDRAAFVEQISAALPLMLSMVGNPGFQDKLAAAAGVFLRDPQNIAITVTPAQPVDLMTLMMTAQTAPQTLPDMLNAEVQANQPAAAE